MRHLFWKGAAYDCEENDFIMKNFTHTFNNIGFILRSMPICVSDNILFIQALIFKQKYITGDYMLTSSDIFFELKSSTWVSDLWGLMRRILYLIFISLYCYVTVPLVKTLHCHKWALTCRVVFLCSAIIEHDFISRFLVVIFNFGSRGQIFYYFRGSYLN